MHLVLEQVREQARQRLPDRAGAPRNRDLALQRGGVERVAERDQAAVAERLRGLQPGAGRARLLGIEEGSGRRVHRLAGETAFERIEVEQSTVRLWFSVALIEGKKPVRGASNSA